MTKGFEEGAANTRTCAFHKQMNGACLVGSNLDRLRNCSRTLVVERPRALRKRMKDDERNENVMANGDRPSPMPMVRSGGTRPVRLMLDSGCFKKRSWKKCFTVGCGFHPTQFIWWERMVRCGSRTTASPIDSLHGDHGDPKAGRPIGPSGRPCRGGANNTIRYVLISMP